MNKAKLLGASIVGNGLRYARRPDVFVGPANNGFMAGDFLDANGVVDTSSAIAETKATEIAGQITANAVEQLEEEIGEVSTPETTIGTPKVVGKIVNGDVVENVYEVTIEYVNPTDSVTSQFIIPENKLFDKVFSMSGSFEGNDDYIYQLGPTISVESTADDFPRQYVRLHQNSSQDTSISGVKKAWVTVRYTIKNNN